MGPREENDALWIILDNEKKVAGMGMTRADNEEWVIVKLVRDNWKRGCAGFYRKGGAGAGLGLLEILKLLDVEFVEGRVESLTIARVMKDAAGKRRIEMGVGVGDEYEHKGVRGIVKKMQASRRRWLGAKQDISDAMDDCGGKTMNKLHLGWQKMRILMTSMLLL